MQFNFRRQTGATLIEIIMVVALIAVITIGSFMYYNSASQASKVQEALTGLDAISQIIQNQYATSTNYSGLTEGVVVNSGSVASNIKSSVAGNLKHPWSAVAAAVTIGVNPAAVPAASSFLITYTLVPQGACVDLVSKAFNKYPLIRVNGTSITNAGVSSVACTTTSNTIAFTQN